jgi:hypothetical protein
MASQHQRIRIAASKDQHRSIQGPGSQHQTTRMMQSMYIVRMRMPAWLDGGHRPSRARAEHTLSRTLKTSLVWAVILDDAPTLCRLHRVIVRYARPERSSTSRHLFFATSFCKLPTSSCAILTASQPHSLTQQTAIPSIFAFRAGQSHPARYSPKKASGALLSVAVAKLGSPHLASRLEIQ